MPAVIETMSIFLLAPISLMSGSYSAIAEVGAQCDKPLNISVLERKGTRINPGWRKDRFSPLLDLLGNLLGATSNLL